MTPQAFGLELPSAISPPTALIHVLACLRHPSMCGSGRVGATISTCEQCHLRAAEYYWRVRLASVSKSLRGIAWHCTIMRERAHSHTFSKWTYDSALRCSTAWSIVGRSTLVLPGKSEAMLPMKALDPVEAEMAMEFASGV